MLLKQGTACQVIDTRHETLVADVGLQQTTVRTGTDVHIMADTGHDADLAMAAFPSLLCDGCEELAAEAAALFWTVGE
jgi:hypothetical protein